MSFECFTDHGIILYLVLLGVKGWYGAEHENSLRSPETFRELIFDIDYEFSVNEMTKC